MTGGGRQGTPGFDRRRLQALRRQLGQTQAALARRAEVPEDAVAMWESGHRVPGVANVAALARALGVDPLDMTERDEGEDLTLVQLRVHAGLSQQEAAERARLQRTTYSVLERGEKVNLSPADMTALARAYGVEEDLVRTAYAASRRQYVERRAGRGVSD